MKGDVIFLDLIHYKFVQVTTTKDKNSHLPYNIEPENVTPIFTEMKGWKADLTGNDNVRMNYHKN